MNIRKILIVGGGSSGWMTAAFLSKKLERADITLIEASDVPIIGVGESTNPTMKYFMRALGYEEKSFMRACDASFKRAIRFQNFNDIDGVLYHPFGQTIGDDFNPGAQADYKDFESIKDGTLFSNDCVYSYQVDAGLLAEYLKRECKRANSVRHIVDKVSRVKLGSTGDIAAVGTLNSGELTADLYIDCTGFKAFLLDETMCEPFESSSSSLLNDRAIATRIQYSNKESELVTHTNCVALSAGWAWQIPLWSRIGVGYVYSSKYLSAEKAEQELMKLCGITSGDNCQLNHLCIRVGRHRRAWVKNCVAIGISYGFLEPLESTGLSLTQVAIADLFHALNSSVSLSVEREMYNARQRALFDSTRDFIVAHYALTKRTDTPYWRHVKNELFIPDSLIRILMDARQQSYQAIVNNPHCFYQKASWNCILSGMGYFGEDQSRVRPLIPGKGLPHAAVLREQIFGCDKADYSSVEQAIVSHPVWMPTW